MLHFVKLPSETRKYLWQLSRIQIGVLEAVVEIFPFDKYILDETLGKDEKEKKQNEIKQNLENELSQKLKENSYCRRKAAEIAAWICNAEGRWKPLVRFLTETGGKEVYLDAPDDKIRAEKQWLIKSMKQDICLLCHKQPRGILSVHLDFHSLPPELKAAQQFINSQTGERKKLPLWLASLREYFETIYEGLGNGGIVAKIFKDRDKNYSRQDFFEAFTQANPKLFVCPICDASGFRTISGGHYYSDIEHYLPKSIYPHLAIHPYNLIPVCKLCNQAIKRDEDPFRPEEDSTVRYALGDIFLPYRKRVMSREAILKIDWLGSKAESDLTDEDYVWRKGQKGARKSGRFLAQARTEDKNPLQAHFKLFNRIYSIPGRWEEQIDEIGDHLFRRIRQVFADDVLIDPAILNSKERVINKINWLLVLTEEVQGQDIYTYPIMWWLSQLTLDYLDNCKEGTPSPFWDEIKAFGKLVSGDKRDITDRAGKIKERYKGSQNQTLVPNSPVTLPVESSNDSSSDRNDSSREL
ncbi:MAG: hypothetical protein HS114_00595 [Anaerolineales bacterium]|nr:hypothetical protein [Anaerolineales bacterium]